MSLTFRHVLYALFVLILYVPVISFSVMSGWVFLGGTITRQRIKCLIQRHNAMPLVRLEPATRQPRVKHTSTEALCPSYCMH